MAPGPALLRPRCALQHQQQPLRPHADAHGPRYLPCVFLTLSGIMKVVGFE